ncbi:MAG TPA: 3-hydroxyacyl-CoA dehydrogenase family protein [Geobacteraceae bacterium]|nr:3-hydroxyacyl-CoA dehydrogenase family protein [Geobacteraceae bacterium]
MKIEDIKTVGVVGCGSMGSGIIQVAAQAGYQVKVVDTTEAAWARADKTIRTSLERMLKKEKITEQEMKETLGRISFSTDIGTLGGAQYIIEAVFENIDVKKDLFARLEPVVGADTIIATNTSSLSITEMASLVKNPANFVGMHFFNPVPMMKLVEVIPAIQTSPETTALSLELGKSFGKTPITCKDTPGFVLNRLLVPYMMDAIRLLEDGVASAEDIDTAMKLGAGMPMGPLELQDFAGVDIGYYVGDIFFNYTKDARFAPPTLLRNMVKAGYVGRKAGRGFYDYSAEK